MGDPLGHSSLLLRTPRTGKHSKCKALESLRARPDPVIPLVSIAVPAISTRSVNICWLQRRFEGQNCLESIVEDWEESEESQGRTKRLPRANTDTDVWFNDNTFVFSFFKQVATKSHKRATDSHGRLGGRRHAMELGDGSFFVIQFVVDSEKDIVHGWNVVLVAFFQVVVIEQVDAPSKDFTEISCRRFAERRGLVRKKLFGQRLDMIQLVVDTVKDVMNGWEMFRQCWNGSEFLEESTDQRRTGRFVISGNAKLGGFRHSSGSIVSIWEHS
jgi:hypothetical protein